MGRWHTDGERVQKKFRYLLSAFDIPLEKLAYCFVLMFSIISKSTPFLLKLNLQCKLPNFILVSNTSEAKLRKAQVEGSKTLQGTG